MPKLGTSIRIFSAVAAARDPRGRRRGRAPSRQSGTVISGAGSTFVAPLVAPVGRACRLRVRLQLSTADRLRRRHQAITSRTVDFGASDAPLSAGPVHGLQRLRADSVGTRWDIDHVQPARRQEPPAHGRPDAREDLPRPDHEVERPGDRRAQPGVTLPSTRSRSPTAPTAPARRTTSPTTSRGQPGVVSRRSGG